MRRAVVEEELPLRTVRAGDLKLQFEAPLVV